MNNPQDNRSIRWNRAVPFFVAALFVSAALIGASHAAGDLDQAFGNGGKVLTDFSGNFDIAYDMAVQTDGKIVVVGVTGNASDFAIARYNSNGSLDSSFGTGGKVTTDFSATNDAANGVAIQADGKIVVVGGTVTGNPAHSSFAVARYDVNGVLDPTFGTGGKVSTDFFSNGDIAKAVVIQADNKILVAGTVRNTNDTDFGLARYNSNGNLDTNFDGDGKVTTDIFAYDTLTALALYPGDRIVVAGYSGASGNDDFSLARYNSNGSLDTTFDADGKLHTDFGSNFPDRLQAVAIQADGKIVTAGYTYVRLSPPDAAFALIRYNSDGSLDTSFDGDGKTVTVLFSTPNPCCSMGDEVPNDIAITTGGRILVAGYTAFGDFTLSRYMSNGSLDINFGDRGRIFSHLTPHFVRANAVSIQSDGKILAAGFGTSSQSTTTGYDFVLARFEANPRSLNVRSDFDLDAKSDVAVFRPSDGTWYVLNSSDGAVQAQPFGTSGDLAVPGDYDGDGGGTDFAVFRPSNGTWYILQSSNGAFRAEQFGVNGDIPVAADYDGDGKTDVAVYRPSTGFWYVLNSSDNSFQAQQFGISTDRPVPGYYDGDGKADIAVFRDSVGVWYIMESSTNTLRSEAWGSSGDQPIQADYDGDGNFDLAVFRPSNGVWYIQRSFDNVLFALEWGVAGDRPVPGDYNGDFKTDVAVWRPNNGTWYIYNLPNVGYQYIPFGMTGDTPVAAAYLP